MSDSEENPEVEELKSKVDDLEAKCRRLESDQADLVELLSKFALKLYMFNNKDNNEAFQNHSWMKNQAKDLQDGLKQL